MSDSAPDLGSLLCSRLCHDMTSPVGAFANALELLADEDDAEMRRRCLALLEQSARTAGDRLKFYRVAFGASGGARDAVALAELRVLVAGVAGGDGRVALHWAVAAEALPRIAAKVLLNLALIALDALPRGGALAIGAEAGAESCEIALRATGPRLAFDPEVGRALEGALPPDARSSRTAPAAMIADLTASRGGRIRTALAEDALVLGADLPIA